MKTTSLICLIFAIACVNAQYRSAAELFDGAYSFVHRATPTGEINSVGKIGNIGYWPAFPGALYGNMSVSYGTPGFGPSTPCATVMSDFSSYTGGYEVFPNGDGNGLGPFVEHYPIISSNPINGNTPVGVPARRYFRMSEFDTLLDVQGIVGTPGAWTYQNTLRWRRNFPFPRPGERDATVKIHKTNGWSSGGINYNQYTVTIVNTGGRPINNAVIELSLGPNSAMSQSSNFNKVSGTYNQYNAPLWGLASGSTSTSASFTVTGNGIPYAGLNPANLS